MRPLSSPPSEYPYTIPHGLMFHHFHDAKHPRGQGSISSSDFERILGAVGMDRIMAPGTWLEDLDAAALTPSQVCLTFDDALLCQFDIALPVLEKYGLKAFWFIHSCVFEGRIASFEVYRRFRSQCFESIDDFYQTFFAKVFVSDFSDRAKLAVDDTEISRKMKCFPFYSRNDIAFRLMRDRVLDSSEYKLIMDDLMTQHGVTVQELVRDLWMTDEHLRYLVNEGHEVGLHSYSHPMVLADLPADEQRREYARNSQHIRRVCGRTPVAMAHPANSYNQQTIEILKEIGIKCGFRSNAAPGRDGEPLNPSRYELAREDHSNILFQLNKNRGATG